MTDSGPEVLFKVAMKFVDDDDDDDDDTHGRIIQCAQCARAQEAAPQLETHHKANVKHCH